MPSNPMSIGLAHLGSLDSESFDQLALFLSNSKAIMSSEDLNQRLIAQFPNLEPTALSSIMRVLRAFTTAMRTRGVSVEQIVDDANRFLSTEPDLEIAPILTRLELLLRKPGGLATASKALGIFVDHPNAFKSARILSDIRPVFSSTEPLHLEATTVVHTLKIEYRQDNEIKHFYVALDALDLSELERIVIRAKEKQEVLERTLETLAVPYMRVE